MKHPNELLKELGPDGFEKVYKKLLSITAENTLQADNDFCKFINESEVVDRSAWENAQMSNEPKHIFELALAGVTPTEYAYICGLQIGALLAWEMNKAVETKTEPATYASN
jgi:hypothetical protein